MYYYYYYYYYYCSTIAQYMSVWTVDLWYSSYLILP